ncbi:MAG TPA: 2-C-methyl-D-erythritol 4-phosphate cytidylyltransferase [Gemmatimonadales bacterium]
MCPNSGPISPPDVGVLIPAGGRGDRAGPGEPKQFRVVAGVPLLLRTLRPFMQHPRVRQVVVALPSDSVAAPPAWLGDLAGERLRLVEGGTTRQDSVGRALAGLTGECAIVLVHDAARPFVSLDEIDAVLGAITPDRGAIVAIPVSDTLKRGTESGEIVDTVSRADLWRALTPQGFPRAMLEDAYRQAERAGGPARTDEAALVQAAGGTVVMIRGAPANLKITTPEDFSLAELLAAR